MSNSGLFYYAHSQTWSCHVTQVANLKILNFSLNNFRKSKKISDKKVPGTSKVMSQITSRGRGVENNPPLILGLRFAEAIHIICKIYYNLL